MPRNEFFGKPSEQSAIKISIVSKYFQAWAKVIMPTARGIGGKIAYVDLFCGPGQYRDGTKSTPLLVLEKAISNPDLREMLITVFNDKDEDNRRSLQQAIEALPGIGTLKHVPRVVSKEIGGDIVKIFDQLHRVPTLFFVDPWGYKGLSLDLVNTLLKDWGCDCIFFFNFNRINMALENRLVQEHMDALFGQQRAIQLRQRLRTLPPELRESEIVDEICKAIRDSGTKYVLPFCFKNANGRRTSHHLIFASKHPIALKIMKEIMAKESSDVSQGVATFKYSPADNRQPRLFELSRPLDDLQSTLLQRFAGQTLTTKEICEQQNVDGPYIDRNCKEALRGLELAGKITAEPPTAKRPPGTFANHVKVTFPKKRG